MEVIRRRLGRRWIRSRASFVIVWFCLVLIRNVTDENKTDAEMVELGEEFTDSFECRKSRIAVACSQEVALPDPPRHRRPQETSQDTPA